jgi:non-specific serine/threonine protein kinase
VDVDLARVGLCRLNSKGAAAAQSMYLEGRWANVAAFCSAIGMPRSTYFALVKRDKWFEIATIQDKLTLIGIPQADQAALCEFKGFETDLILASTCPNNLPIQPTAFIGRESHRAAVKQLLSTATLLTLTGSGGCGKTRLALQIGAEMLADTADGVWVVELASLMDEGLVVQALLLALGIREEPNRPLIDTVIAYLTHKSLLLILDNCEHLIFACAQLATALMRSCPHLRILATSREALAIAGETVWRVPSMPSPDSEAVGTLKDLSGMVMEYESCQLFIQRAREAGAALELSCSSAVSVARICERLDGIPLAIELAAACVRYLSVEEISFRLDKRFQLLTGGSRTAIPRHKTLHALIDWSWETLGDQEKTLLSRLSVFAGGWAIEAAEFVCTPYPADASSSADAQLSTLSDISGDDVIGIIASLTAKSLVVAETKGETTRYRLLETIRQYSMEKLTERAEAKLIRCRHHRYYMALAEEAELQLQSAEQGKWLIRLEVEHDNLRAVMAEKNNRDSLRLAVLLWRFWDMHGHLTEGRSHLSCLLTEWAGKVDPALFGNALNCAGNLAQDQGDYDSARSLYEQCIEIRRASGDRQGTAGPLNNLGLVAWLQGDCASARTMYGQALQINREFGNRAWEAANLANLGNVLKVLGDSVTSSAVHKAALEVHRELGDRRGIANDLIHLGNAASDEGDYAMARALYEQALEVHCELGDRVGESTDLGNLGNLAADQKNYTEASSLYEQALNINRELGDRAREALNLGNWGTAAAAQGDYASARALIRQSLTIRQDLGDKLGISESLKLFANLALKEQDAERYTRLWAAADALTESIGVRLMPKEQRDHREDIAQVMGDAAFLTAWEQGRAMPMGEAIELALNPGQ